MQADCHFGDFDEVDAGANEHNEHPAFAILAVSKRMRTAKATYEASKSYQEWLTEMQAAGLYEVLDGRVMPIQSEVDRLAMLNRVLAAGHAVAAAQEEVHSLENLAASLATARALASGITLEAPSE